MMFLKASLLLLLSFNLNAQNLDLKNPFSIDDDVNVNVNVNKEKPKTPEEAELPPPQQVESGAKTAESGEKSSEPAIPRLAEPVVDQAGVFSAQEKAALSQKIRSVLQNNGPQIQILLVDNLQGMSIEEYSIRVAEKWKIGKKEKDDGIIILMSQADREVRIEVGGGVEGELTDLESHQIIQNVMIPRFKQGNFYQGFDSALDAIVSEFGLKNGASEKDLSMPENIAQVRHEKEQMVSFLLPIIIFFATFPLLFKLLGKNALVRSVAGSAYLGALTFFLVGQMFFIILAVIFGFLIGLVGPLNFLMATLSHRGRGRYYGGGRGGFGGGGGWSGGGGGFSGGGASGRW